MGFLKKAWMEYQYGHIWRREEERERREQEGFEEYRRRGKYCSTQFRSHIIRVILIKLFL